MTDNMNLGAPEIILVLVALFYLVPLVDIYRSKSKDTFEKIVWTCIVLVLPIAGTVVYLSVGRKHRFLYQVMKKFYGSS